MILFRTDGNTEIGMGHVMRCLSIADAFVGAGEECFFVLADGLAKAAVENRGFRAFVLDACFGCMEAEIPGLQGLIRRLKPDWLVVDSYFVTGEYLGSLRALCKVAYLDDLAAFAYPVDCLINYNVYAADMGYATLYGRAGIRLPHCFLGSGYAPLREGFRDIPVRVPDKDVRDVLVSTGGADPAGLALGLTKFLAGEPGCVQGMRFHLVLGEMNRDKGEVVRIALGAGNVVLHQSVQDMKSLMLMCDIAVSAAGSTLYELCACGTPTVTYALADNQICGAEAFRRMGVMVSLGDVRVDTGGFGGMVVRAVLDLAGDFRKRREMGRRMQGLVDGYGAERLVEGLMGQ